MADDDAKGRALVQINEAGIRLTRDETGKYVSARIPADLARTVEQPELAIRALGELDTIREVDASQCRVTKGMLESLLSLKSVRILQLAGAKFEDQDVARPKARALENLDLSGSNANDALLLAIGAIPSIRELNLSETEVRGDGLVALSRLKNLQSLNLSRTITMPDGAKHLEYLTSLVRLDLSFTQFGRGGENDAKFLTTLKHLECLNLDRTPVDDHALVELDKLTALRELSLQVTAVSYRGLAHIKSLKNLTTLRCYTASRNETHKDLFELKKRLPNVRIADLVLRASGIRRQRDKAGEITSLTIDLGREAPAVNALIEVGELTKVTRIEFTGSERDQRGLEDLILPKTITYVDAHQVAIPAKIITKIVALPKLETLHLWGDSLTEESRAELMALADRVEVYLSSRGGIKTRLRKE